MAAIFPGGLHGVAPFDASGLLRVHARSSGGLHGMPAVVPADCTGLTPSLPAV
jgi:hypothetical protein